MPSTVFPAPGCESGKQFLMPFQGFDISHDTGGSFSNLLTNSVDLTHSDWIRGVDNQAVVGESAFDIVEDYINEPSILPYQPIYVYKNDFGEHTIVSSSSTQYFGQEISVTPGTDYTFSFYAKRGTATEVTYGIYDLTNETDIVPATSYYNDISATLWSRITATFNTGTSTSINAFVLWNITTGSPGSVNIFGPQLDLGTSAKVYDPTGSISWAAQGLTTIGPQYYGRSHLGTFSDPSKDFEALPIHGQSSARWQVVNDYIFDNSTLTYSSAGTNNVLTIPEQTARPYQVGDSVTVTNSNTGYRQNFQVTAFTTTSITINTTNAVPINGSFVVNPAPQVYPQSLTTVAQYRNTSVARENLFAVTFSPNLRGVDYFLDREFSTTSALSIADFKLPSLKVNGVEDRRSVAKVLPRTNIHTPIDLRTTGKVLPRTNIASIADSRRTTSLINKFTVKSDTTQVFSTPSAGKVLPRSNINGIVDRRSVSRTETLTATGSTLYARFPSGIPAKSGTTINILENITANDVTLSTNTFRLESFDNQGIFPGDILDVDVKYNSVNEYIYDLDILSSVVSTRTGQQTLFYKTNVFYPFVFFPAGFYVRINDRVRNTSYIVQVISSTSNSITFNAIPGFPNTATGQGLTIQSATSFVYPKTKVDSEMYAYIALNGINLYNYPTKPRENLSASEVKPNFRPATELSIEKNSFGDTLPAMSSTVGKMSTFDAGLIPGDFKLPITGQSSNSTNNAVVWYRDELDRLTITPTTVSPYRIFFPVQEATPYPSGSQVRLINTFSGLNQIVNVIEGTNSSISFNGTIPVGGGTIERIESTVYPQQYVSTTTAPTTPRENLFYSTLAVGYRSNNTLLQRTTMATDGNTFNTQKLNAASVVKAVFNTPTSNNLEKRVTSLRSTNNLPAVSKLSSAVKVVPDRSSFRVERVNDLFQQSSVVVRGRPTNARENLYYFNLAPGYRSNSSIDQGRLFVTGNQPLPTNTLNKQVALLRTDQTSLSTGKLKSATPLTSDKARVTASLINKFTVRSDTVQLFYTPQVDKVSQGFVVRPDRTTLSASNLSRQIALLKADQNRLIVDKLSTAAVLRTDRTTIKAEKLELFKVNFNTTEVFETPASSNINRQIAKLTSDQSILSTNKLSAATTVKGFSSNLTFSTLEKKSLPIAFNDNVRHGIINQFIVESFATEVFSVPNSNVLKNGLVVRDLSVNLNSSFIVNKGLVVRGEPTELKPTIMVRFNTPASKSQVFDEPQLGKLSSAVVVRQSTETAAVGRLRAAVKVVGETNTLRTGITDNYSDQRIYTTLGPNTSSVSKLQYFNIAPGFRYNKSIEQGLLYGSLASKINAESLATFDNVGLVTDPFVPVTFTTDPVFSVSGRTSNVTTNSVLYYINDLDILTITPVGTPTVTLYFYARDWLPAPMPAGTQITIRHITGYTKTVSVIGGDAGSVTIVDPGDLPSTSGMTIARLGIGYAVTVYFSTRINPPYTVNSYITLINNQNNTRATEQVIDCGLNYVTYVKSVEDFWLPEFDNATIASASVSIIPKSTVSTTTAPTTPREYLYYAELARGYKYGVLNTVFGSTLSEDTFKVDPYFLEKDFFRLKEAVDVDTARTLELELFKLAQPNKRDLVIEFLNPVKFKDFKNQVFTVAPSGQIIRFKTGDFKPGSRGIVDVAAPKKEPIQFWN